MVFGWSRPSESQEPHLAKARVGPSLLPPKRQGNSYSILSQRSCSSEDSSEAVESQSQQKLAMTASNKHSRHSQGSTSRGGGSAMDRRPLRSDRSDRHGEEGRHKGHSLSFRGRGVSRSDPTMKSTYRFQSIQKDKIPLGQQSDFGSESSSYHQGPSQNRQHWHYEQPQSQTFHDSQSSGGLRRSSLLGTSLSMPSTFKRTHFAHDSRHATMQQPAERPMQFLSQESSMSHVAGPPAPLEKEPFYHLR